MFASLVSRHDGELPVFPAAVSNDQMRDHHMQMLSTRNFLKWRERHWVNFHFDERDKNAAPSFVFPSKFSIRMQVHIHVYLHMSVYI